MPPDRGYRTLGELCELRATTHADRPALRDDTGELTYAELAARARAVAALLARRGVDPGERVMVQGPNCLTWVVAAYGVLLAGATVVPVGHRVAETERDQLVETLGPRLLLLADEQSTAEPPVPTVRFSELDRLPPRAEPCREGRWTDSAAEALVLSSSGTTGGLKSVPMNHWQLVRLYDDVRLALAVGGDDRWLGSVPLAHSFGFNGVLLVAFMAGGLVRLTPEYDRATLSELVRSERLTVIAGPPTIFHDLVEADVTAAGSVRLAIAGSTEVSARDMSRLAGQLGIPRVVAGYGMTETCGTVAVGELPGEPEGPLPWMLPLPGVEVRICDDVRGELPVGEQGWIQVRGYNVSRPYVNAPDLAPGGWLDTGDLGVLDEGGRLAVAGRSSDLVIVSGFNVYPREVESVLRAHPGVAGVAVVGVPDRRRGQRLVACVVPTAQRPAPAHLTAYARQRLTAYKVPGQVLLLDELPVTSTGKISRATLRRLVEEADGEGPGS